MFPLLGGLISGGASLLGGMFSSQQSQQNTQAQIAGQEQMQQQSEQFNADQAQINRDYQTQMSNTAYQRATKDMQAAGLNPMMMFGSGSAASSPSGSTASTGTPTMPTPQTKSPLGGLGEAVSAGLNSAISAKTMDKMTDEIANLKAQRAEIDARAATERERPEQVRAETVRTENQSQNLAAEYYQRKLAGKSAEDILDLPDAVRRTGNVASWGANKASDVLAPIVNSATSVRRLLPSRSTSETTRDGDQTFTERWDNRVR